MSYRAAAECIISTAQQARPKVMGQREPLRAQLTRSSTLLTTYSTPFLVLRSWSTLPTLETSLEAGARRGRVRWRVLVVLVVGVMAIVCVFLGV
jgi:hypothetical protein